MTAEPIAASNKQLKVKEIKQVVRKGLRNYLKRTKGVLEKKRVKKGKRWVVRW